MTDINLLPWREQARQVKKIRFAILSGSTIVAAFLLVIFVHIYLNQLINHQMRRNQFLQSAIDKEQAVVFDLNKKKKELATISTQLNFLFNLRRQSYQAVHLLNELILVMPEPVSFNKLVREKNHVLVFGKAKSNLEITQLMKNIDASHQFKQPELTEINAREGSTGDERFFQLKIIQED